MEKRMSNLMKNVILAGIGAAASTSEKAKDIMEELVKKGELTVEQGKVLNEELKHNIQETLEKEKQKKTSAEDLLKSMTPEQIEGLKELLNRMEQEKAKSAETEKGADE